MGLDAGEAPDAATPIPFDDVERPTDIALGSIDLAPGMAHPPIWGLGDYQMATATKALVYGYAQTDWHEYERADGGRSLATNFVPRFYSSIVDEHLEHRGNARWPIYVHRAETLSGISGGPFVDAETFRVCGVNCQGMDHVDDSTASDIRVILDNKVDFVGGKTLRALADVGLARMMPPRVSVRSG